MTSLLARVVPRRINLHQTQNSVLESREFSSGILTHPQSMEVPMGASPEGQLNMGFTFILLTEVNNRMMDYKLGFGMTIGE
ncbi:hypothetical protein OPV22_004751 [Ensete ventricosum]|uniref:Uncharacterized protein n=1 Tax=Ensete ventricosum TaxID=4639 RepID=A0AAV8RQ17_ENSVE|nr:hypothetical protein OPV22_004751 [Ensete ventricosum]